ncbi:aminotransferase class I/II-fold pyridoxal phosphate-dependent enzyme [Tenacibaculum sp. C7A-26P2]|uniref:aminotransferase class I/II-fold pyridoxal phosphate-dependent enzyme n=1 Tax=Tenacibaculum sp. C7A-26P2 TaxID=3447504 RepID=UPI003F85AF20
MEFPKKLKRKISLREIEGSLRTLGETNNLVDFSSNDYLGFAKSKEIRLEVYEFLMKNEVDLNGATGSRLLSGNHQLYDLTEKVLCSIHNSESALIFNSGYNANLGFFSCVPQRNDIILFDELIHASIRDGIRLSNAQSYKFEHNNSTKLENILQKFSSEGAFTSREIYVVTESIFSMDGDTPDLKKMLEICESYGAYFVVDEAHAIGLSDKKELGIIQNLKLEDRIFARILTFGKSLGCHGAVILGSNDLRTYLVNYSRSFIYTTGLAPHSLAAIWSAHKFLQGKLGELRRGQLHSNIDFFKKKVYELNLNFIESSSAIHCCIISGNQKTKEIAQNLYENGFDVKPILSPTVTKGKERLRFCLHSYNNFDQITKVLGKLTTFVS